MIYLIVSITYILISSIWFIVNLGKKNKKDYWYEYILCVPIILIAFIFSLVYNIKERL